MAQKSNAGKVTVPAKARESEEESKRQEELARVREIILGPDKARQTARKVGMERLRDAILGTQIEEYERRFTDLQREMERLIGDFRQVRDSLGEFQKSQTKRIEALERETRRANDELTRELDRLRGQSPAVQQLLTQSRQQQMLAQGLTDETNELRKTVAQQEQDIRSLRTTADQFRDRHERGLDGINREVRQAEDQLRAEVRRVADRLDDQKADRKALAAMLMEMATRLETGSSVAGLLGELTAPAEE
ncbi:MAG TPA: hypothetical protein VMX14_08410 [Anaerolineae bacterium]|nr:hypothetical protein [Anaerolineae bacterium]